MKNEYIANCKGILFVAHSYKEAVDILKFNGSTFDCIVYDGEVIAHLDGHGKVQKEI